MKNTTKSFMLEDLKDSFISEMPRVFNTDGKANMVVNHIADYMNGDINGKQFSEALYWTLKACINGENFDNIEIKQISVDITLWRHHIFMKYIKIVNIIM